MKTYKTVIRLEELNEDDLETYVKATIIAWDFKSVWLPMSLFAEAIQGLVPSSDKPIRVIANVNIYAGTVDKLNIHDVYLAPEIPKEWIHD